MHGPHLVQRAVVLILLLSTGFAIGLAWWKFGRRTVIAPARNWNAINLGIVSLLTLGYSYFPSALVFLLTPWRESFFHWPFYRNAVGVADLNILMGLAASALAFGGRGAARVQIVRAGLLLTLMSIFMLYGMAAD